MSVIGLAFRFGGGDSNLARATVGARKKNVLRYPRNGRKAHATRTGRPGYPRESHQPT